MFLLQQKSCWSVDSALAWLHGRSGFGFADVGAGSSWILGALHCGDFDGAFLDVYVLDYKDAPEEFALNVPIVCMDMFSYLRGDPKQAFEKVRTASGCL